MKFDIKTKYFPLKRKQRKHTYYESLGNGFYRSKDGKIVDRTKFARKNPWIREGQNND